MEKLNLRWKNVAGYDGRYAVSESGLVAGISGKILKPRLNIPNGYYIVSFQKDGRSKRHLVHRLVAENFIPRVDGKPHVNHRDGNRLNNTVENLEWCTASENARHAWTLPRKKPVFTNTANMGRPKNVEAIETVKRLRGGKNPMPFRKIAALLNTDLKTCYRWHRYNLAKKKR